MRFKKIVGDNGYVELFFLISGHSHNVIDQRHSSVQKKWSATSSLLSIPQWIHMIDSIPNCKAEELIPFDFKSWITPLINPESHNLMTNNIHVFRFTFHGLITKKFAHVTEFSEWRGRSTVNGSTFEPFHVIVDSPAGAPINLVPKPKRMFSFINSIDRLIQNFRKNLKTCLMQMLREV